MSAATSDITMHSNLCSKLRTATCKTTWLIEKFSCRQGGNGDYIESDKFSTGVRCDWCWRLYPWGKTDTRFVQAELVYLQNGTVSAKCEYWLANEKSEKVDKKELTTRKFVPAQACLVSLPDCSQIRDTAQGYLRDDTLTLHSILTTFKDCETSVSWIKNASLEEPSPTEDVYCQLWKCRDYTDLVLVADEKKFEVHKAVLAMRSSVFNAMFRSNMKENSENEVQIEDISSEVLQEMLNFIYTNTVNNISAMASDLLQAAEKYDLKRLKAMCEEELTSSLSVDNVASILRLADKFNAAHLKNVATCYVNAHADEVKDTDGWKALVEEDPRLLAGIYDALVELSVGSK